MNHTIRSKDGTTMTFADYPRNKAIKAMCYECMGWDGDPKVECTSPQCPLYPYRGKIAHRTDEQRAAASAMMKARIAETGLVPGAPQ